MIDFQFSMRSETGELDVLPVSMPFLQRITIVVIKPDIKSRLRKSKYGGQDYEVQTVSAGGCGCVAVYGRLGRLWPEGKLKMGLHRDSHVQ